MWAPEPIWKGAENLASTSIRWPDRQGSKELSRGHECVCRLRNPACKGQVLYCHLWSASLYHFFQKWKKRWEWCIASRWGLLWGGQCLKCCKMSNKVFMANVRSFFEHTSQTETAWNHKWHGFRGKIYWTQNVFFLFYLQILSEIFVIPWSIQRDFVINVRKSSWKTRTILSGFNETRILETDFRKKKYPNWSVYWMSIQWKPSRSMRTDEKKDRQTWN